MFKFTWAALGCLLASAPLAAQSVSGDLRGQIAPSGTLRAAINYNNPLLAKRDPTTGELSGVAVDLSRELARRIGVPVELLPYQSAGKITDDARTGAWDIAFQAIDPARAVNIDYTAPYLELEGAYLVPPGSALQSIDEVDRGGVRIGVTANSAYDLFLSRQLKHARLARYATTPISIQHLIPDKLDAVAAVRTALMPAARLVPGSRMLAGHFMTIPQAAAIPKGRPEATRYIAGFIEEMKSSGFIAAALERHGLGPDDAIIAPAAAVTTAEATYVVTYLEVRSRAINAGATLVRQYVRETRVETGNTSVDAFQEVDRGDRFVLVESWRDEASFQAHEMAAHTLEFRRKLGAIHRCPEDQRVTHGFSIDPRRVAGPPGAFYVVTHVDVPVVQREPAEALLTSFAAATRSAHDNLRYDVYQQLDPRTNHFEVFAIWRNQGFFDAYQDSPDWLKFRAQLAPLEGALYDQRLYRRLSDR
jgi:polar amino acid transport system substrate-binding protein